MKLLDMRAFELKSTIHDVLENIWNYLVHVDNEAQQVAILDGREGMLRM